MHDFIYLASQSPRRRQLLDQLGVRYVVLAPDESEDAEALEQVLPQELPEAYVQRVTLAKLKAAQQRLAQRGLPAAPLLCADTTVALDDDILGKPQDAAHATATLQRLSGRRHQVLTALALATPQGAIYQALSRSSVQFAPLPPARLAAYVASGEPMGKAGAYAIQSRIAGWISHIEGSYSGIMGLPLFETTQLLEQSGVRT
ncbi:Maf family protein [Roseateles sp. BYS180W]|uniref:dTTP/UTP pyrophosphatase n=1 Tax=Roseateles rivi TaxID=3299028 RepID=A0ABW7FUU7_9BURK